MMNSSTMADKIAAMMEKKKGDKDTFTMTGQYASSVMYEEDTSREYVMYEAPNGEEVKVYGNWNEYAVGRDEQGKDMIADEDYPIRKNQDGDFVFDEAKFEEMQAKKPQRDLMEEEAPEEMPKAPEQGGGGIDLSRPGSVREMLGGGRMMRKGLGRLR